MELVQNRNYDDSQNAFDTIDLQELYGVQTGIALFLKDASKSLADFQDLSREVLMTANQARALQLETSSIMTQSGITLSHITETMIPLVFKGIESKDLNLLGKAFDQVIEHAESMKNKPKATVERYLQLQQQITNQIKAVETKNETEKQVYKNIQMQLRQEEQLTAQVGNEQKKLKTRKQELEDKMKFLEDQLQRANADVDIGDEADSSPKSSTDQSSSLTQWVMKGWKAVFSGTQSQKTMERNNKMVDLENNIRLLRQENREVSDKLYKINKELIERNATLDELKAHKGRHADTTNLKQVFELLGRVQQHFNRLVLFWESMKNEVIDLKSVFSFGQNIQVKNARASFESYDQNCQNLTMKFKNYVRESEMGICNLFNFLYMSDDTDECDVENRQRALPAV